MISFYTSEDPRIGSLVTTPGLKAYKPPQQIKTPVHTLSSILISSNHTWVDLIKLDIEGVEFDVFGTGITVDDLRALPTSQLLVEFHSRLFDANTGWDLQTHIYQKFVDAGWEIAYEQPKRKEEVVFIRVEQ